MEHFLLMSYLLLPSLSNDSVLPPYQIEDCLNVEISNLPEDPKVLLEKYEPVVPQPGTARAKRLYSAIKQSCVPPVLVKVRNKTDMNRNHLFNNDPSHSELLTFFKLNLVILLLLYHFIYIFVILHIFQYQINCSHHSQMIRSLLPSRLRTAWKTVQMTIPTCPWTPKFYLKNLNQLLDSLVHQELGDQTQRLNNLGK